MRIEGIYGILPANLDTQALLETSETALKGGIQTLQFRDKKLGFKKALKRAKALRELTQQYHAQLIVNDSIQLAQDAKADGVHLGKDDLGDISAIRRDIGNKMILGITCRADAAFAKIALGFGADYVAFGAVFGSVTKPDVPILGLPRLNKARQMFPDANICAIGGITIDNIAAVKHAGATSAAMISGLFDAPDVELKARELVKQWQSN
jgi:thiamine-phosphate pyrophosphorylase